MNNLRNLLTKLRAVESKNQSSEKRQYAELPTAWPHQGGAFHNVDVIVILDCCYSGSVTQAIKQDYRSVEIIAAVGSAQEAHGNAFQLLRWQKHTFTSKLIRKPNLASQGNGTTSRRLCTSSSCFKVCFPQAPPIAIDYVPQSDEHSQMETASGKKNLFQYDSRQANVHKLDINRSTSISSLHSQYSHAFKWAWRTHTASLPPEDLLRPHTGR